MANRTFIFHPEWYEFISKLEANDQYKLMKLIIGYGTGEDITELLEQNTAMIQTMFLTIIQPKIDNEQKNYVNRREGSRGRSKVIDDNMIAEMASAGMKAAQIAQELGISKDSVYHSEGWRSRKTQ